MIKKSEIIEVLVDYGLSIIECERSVENKTNFEAAIKDIVEKARREGL